MNVADFDFDLPDDLIAQTPASPRDHSRLLVVDRVAKRLSHDYFYNLPKYLSPRDLLVFNNTKVFPARLYGKKETGGQIEILLIKFKVQDSKFNACEWEFIGKNIGRTKKLIFEQGLVGEVVGANRIVFNKDYAELMRVVAEVGYTPLPPYIHTDKSREEEIKTRDKYQTVFAQIDGSVAAPTAGLHFTQELLERLREQETKMMEVTLNIGLGTFLPLKKEIVEENILHSEYYEISKDSKFKAQDSIVAVGTTTVRVLETWAQTGQASGETNIFIYPGYKFKMVDKLITNFHLPKSSLLMLVSAFAGRELVMQAYREAVEKKYRFFSYGDAMLII